MQAQRVEVPCDGCQLARRPDTGYGGIQDLEGMCKGETHRSPCRSLGAHALIG